MHYHGYIYRPHGQGRPPADYDESYRAPWGAHWADSPWVPGMIPWWLLKPRSFIRQTCETPEEAIAWAESLWRPRFDPLGDEHPAHSLVTMDERLEASRSGLAHGRDIVLCGPTGLEYMEIWVLSCPNGCTPPPPCPLGRTDTRPEGLYQITGIPLGV